MHCLRGICLLCVAVFVIVGAMASLATQEPPPPASAAPVQDATTKTNKPGKKRYSHANDFLIRGTVFNETALSFPGVELRFRREGQKKYKWETATNSRGEFAVRVPQGSNYEILVHVKGFADQTRTVDAKNGGNEETVVFRMEPIMGDKK
jgi:carboxypeptidase family protein